MSWCDAEQRVFLAGLVGVSSTDALSIKLVSDAALLLALLPSAFDSSMMSLRRRSAVELVRISTSGAENRQRPT